MSFTEIASLDADTTIALGGVNKQTGKKNPTSVEGYYLGSRQVDGKRGKSNLHFLQTNKGNVGVWGKTDLDRKLSGVLVGTMIRASFVGMTPTPKGDMYKFKVEIDKDNTIEVATLAAGAGNSNSSSYSEDDGTYEGYGTEESVDPDEASYDDDEETQQAALLAAEAAAKEAQAKKARMNAILNKGKK